LTQGSGGVSAFALQFARVLGARVIATTSTTEKAERLRALGASEVINYAETPDWDEKARELTDGRGIDCVVEIGGPATIAKSLKALAVGGHVSLIGASLSPSGTMLDPLLLTGRGITVGAISVGSRADFEAMNRAIALHRLRPGATVEPERSGGRWAEIDPPAAASVTRHRSAPGGCPVYSAAERPIRLSVTRSLARCGASCA
jgi:NADPH:quinone reductase-like Zn-dependent oxidoreductase